MVSNEHQGETGFDYFRRMRIMYRNYRDYHRIANYANSKMIAVPHSKTANECQSLADAIDHRLSDKFTFSNDAFYFTSEEDAVIMRLSQ